MRCLLVSLGFVLIMNVKRRHGKQGNVMFDKLGVDFVID